MKKINLYFYFEFTSLSPDAQPISLGIVSDEYFPEFGCFKQTHGKGSLREKSFYAEFEFDINRCDDWVKENVVSKLEKPSNEFTKTNGGIIRKAPLDKSTLNIKRQLKEWLSQFSDYEIQFVCDCGTFDWYHLLQLIGEWDKPELSLTHFPIESDHSRFLDNDFSKDQFDNLYIYLEGKHKPIYRDQLYIPITGLPKLPSNISPVPQDLNDLIAIRKGISVKEAFDLDREELSCNAENSMMIEKKVEAFRYNSGESWADNNQKHNALWDAKVIKAIFNKLNIQYLERNDIYDFSIISSEVKTSMYKIFSNLQIGMSISDALKKHFERQ
jgi:hypothetical protein